MTQEESDRPTRKAQDAAVKVALVAGAATVAASVVTALGAFAAGWLQYQGPGSQKESAPIATKTITVTHTYITHTPSATYSPGAGQDSALPSPTPGLQQQSGWENLSDLIPLEDEQWNIDTGNLDGKSHPDSFIEGLCPPAVTRTTQSYYIKRAYRRFQVLAGIDDTSQEKAPMIFTLIGDGRTLYRRTISMGKPQKINVKIEGVLRLELRVDTDIDSINAAGCFDETLAVWANGRLQR